MFKISVIAALAIVHFGAAFLDVKKIKSFNAVALDKSRGACPIPFATENPKYLETVKRGSVLLINGMKNNRIGGFVRFSMTTIRASNSKAAHDRYSFFYSCADSNPSKCRYFEKALCKLDKKHQLYRNFVKIPAIYPDGIYTLGIKRYGSFPETHGSKPRGLGDYFGCIRIQVKGGPLRKSHLPRFIPNPKKTGASKYCRVLLNSLDCKHSYCGNPVLAQPDAFVTGKKVKPIKQKSYRSGGNKTSKKWW